MRLMLAITREERQMTGRLTECTEHSVAKPVTSSEFPLGRDKEAKRCDEEKVPDVNVGDRDTPPFHQTERQRSQCRCEGPNGQRSLR